MFERPTTTARGRQVGPGVRRSRIRQPSGVQGTSSAVGAPRPRAAGRRSAGGSRRRPWPGRSLQHRSAPICAGSGSWTRMPCDGRIAIERPDQGEQGRLGWSSSASSISSARRSRTSRPSARLGADIGPAGRVIADQHHAQARRQTMPGGEGRGPGGDLGAQFGSRRPAVDDPGAAHPPCSALLDRLELGQQAFGRPLDVQDLTARGGPAHHPQVARRQPPASGQELDQGRVGLAGLGRRGQTARPAKRGPGRRSRPPAPR